MTRVLKASSMILLALLCAVAAGCYHPAPHTPGFPSHADVGWRSTGIGLSSTATDVANGMIPRLYIRGALESLRPVYVPAPASKHVSWDSLVPTGEILVLTRDAQTYQTTVFGIRPDVASGRWQYTVAPYGFTDAELFYSAIRSIADTVKPHRFQTRFVPTTYGELSWLIVHTTNGATYASPLRLLRGHWADEVDGDILYVGHIMSPDAIRHRVTEVPRPSPW